MPAKKEETKAKEEKKTVAKKAPAKKKAVAKKATVKKVVVKAPAKKKAEVLSKGKARKAGIEFSIGKGEYTASVGKRKSSIARVRLYKGKGNVEVNGRDIREYFFGILTQSATEPLKITDNKKNYDITIKVTGGGISSQADAVRHGISKALVDINPEYRLVLKKLGFLTRDSRVKERKKPGLKRARRAPQWRKR